MWTRALPFLAMIAACAAPQLPPIDPSLANAPWSFDTAAPALRAASCPDSVGFLKAQNLEITAKPIELGPVDAAAKALTGLVYAGGWELTSSEPNFGGLSGIEVLRSGNLLTVSDSGAFVWISMEDGAPSGGGDIAYMRGDDGQPLSGKRDSDSEGLVFENGLALVSFERDHRVLAYDLEGCGGAARGALVGKLPDELAGERLAPNRGAEALSLSADGHLTFVYETGPGGALPTGRLYGNGDAVFGDLVDGPDGYAYVGRDEAGGQTAHLFRSYSPLSGNRNIIRFGTQEARLSKPLAVDNFEGIAIADLPGGGQRLYIISDDNFSKTQRTLLMAFDTAD